MRAKIQTPTLPNFLTVEVGQAGATVQISVADLTDEDIEDLAESWCEAMKAHRNKNAKLSPKAP